MGGAQAALAFTEGGVEFEQLDAFVKVRGCDAPLTRLGFSLPVGDLRVELHF